MGFGCSKLWGWLELNCRSVGMVGTMDECEVGKGLGGRMGCVGERGCGWVRNSAGGCGE